MKESSRYGTAGWRSRVVAATLAATAAAIAPVALAQGFQAPDIEVNEGSDAKFAVTLPHGLNAAVRWEYDTEDGTAEKGQDYTAASGHLKFDAGDTSGEVVVSTSQDGVADDGETFKLKLFNFQMQRASGQWSREAVYGIPDEKTITATIKE